MLLTGQFLARAGDHSERSIALNGYISLEPFSQHAAREVVLKGPQCSQPILPFPSSQQNVACRRKRCGEHQSGCRHLGLGKKNCLFFVVSFFHISFVCYIRDWTRNESDGATFSNSRVHTAICRLALTTR